MSDNEEVYASDVDWQATAETLQAEVTRLQIAAKAEPPITDREQLIEHIAAVSAASRYEYVNFAKHWGDLSDREQKDWVRSEKRLMPTILDAVIAHLSAKEAATEVEWGVREIARPDLSRPMPSEEIARSEVARWNEQLTKGSKCSPMFKVVRRVPAGPWQEVPNE